MDAQIVLWIFGSLIGALAMVCGYLAGRISKLDDRVNACFNKIAENERHLADNYVRGHEISEVKRAIEALRAEVGQAVASIRTEVQNQIGELTKAVLQLNRNK